MPRSLPNSSSQELLSQCEEAAQLLRAMAHPVRLQLLCHLMDGPKNVSELVDCCGISQSGVSQFLGRMKSAGLVVARRQKHHVLYHIEDPRIMTFLSALKEVCCR